MKSIYEFFGNIGTKTISGRSKFVVISILLMSSIGGVIGIRLLALLCLFIILFVGEMITSKGDWYDWVSYSLSTALDCSYYAVIVYLVCVLFTVLLG